MTKQGRHYLFPCMLYVVNLRRDKRFSSVTGGLISAVVYWYIGINTLLWVLQDLCWASTPLWYLLFYSIVCICNTKTYHVTTKTLNHVREQVQWRYREWLWLSHDNWVWTMKWRVQKALLFPLPPLSSVEEVLKLRYELGMCILSVDLCWG